jgi:hypothetical protein
VLYKNIATAKTIFSQIDAVETLFCQQLKYELLLVFLMLLFMMKYYYLCDEFRDFTFLIQH